LCFSFRILQLSSHPITYGTQEQTPKQVVKIFEKRGFVLSDIVDFTLAAHRIIVMIHIYYRFWLFSLEI